ncbi:MAG: hypothetical protein P1P84_03145 [Deferrisomatales bacterium]|nr:hypothetical protein [Deferrisomatales bacterium]
MAETPMGFDAFAAKWVPEPPPWNSPATAQTWRDADTEDGRRVGYREQMACSGPEVPVDLADRLRRDAAAGLPMVEILEWLRGESRIGGAEAASLAVQRVFGVPSSRARFLASWRPGNRSPEARRVLERVALCIADARRAGLWESLD